MSILLTFSTIFSSIWSVILAILLLLVMVTIHEFGHYITGKKLGFNINEFAIGFGPKLFSRKMKTGEDFSIRAIPLGGFCAFDGEDADSDNEGAFNKQPPWKRIIVLVAGAAFNFISTILVIILIFAISGQHLLSVYEICDPVAGEQTGIIESTLEKDDVILSIDGNEIYITTDMTNVLSNAVKENRQYVNLSVIRNGEIIDLKAPLRNYNFVKKDEAGNETVEIHYGLGVLQNYTTQRFGFGETISRSFKYAFKIVGVVYQAFGDLFSGKVPLTDMSGPVSTISLTAKIATLGLRPYLDMFVVIGINLAVFNLLPIPALDGSKIIITIVEWIRKKPINRKVEATIDFVGFVLLFGFAILVDVLKLF